MFRNALGIELPRVSRDMAKNGELVTDRAKLAAGDLVFFGRQGRVNHVGIYVGEGRFLHAPSTRQGRDRVRARHGLLERPFPAGAPGRADVT